MATLASSARTSARNEKFWLVSALLMALVLIAGFSIQLAAGRSSFAVPIYYHVHAFVFFGWTFLYVLQNILVGRENVALHRRLGWLAIGWIPAMIVLGLFMTINIARRGHVPFFFTPAYFLIMNPLAILTFAGLASAAIVMRRRTQWHRRLMFCGMAMLLGPGLGRLLPAPLFKPHAGLVLFAAAMLFPLAGVIRDLRRSGKVHPAWAWGIGALLVAQILTELLPTTTAGLALYEAATRGSPGAAVAPGAYPPSPGP